MTILGIDPGYAIEGWGVINRARGGFELLGYGAVTTPAGMPFARRLETLYRETASLLVRFRPEAVAVEKLFFTTNQKTAIDVAQARGVVMLAIAHSGVPFFEYTPLQVKSAVTGYGKAEKPQVMEMTRRLLKMDTVPRPDDAADALAIAICHGNRAGAVRMQSIIDSRRTK